MRTTKKKPAPSRSTALTSATEGETGEILTLAEAAAYLRVSESNLIELVRSQNLPGRSIGSDWRFLKSAIRLWLSSASMTAESRKEAQLALAGKYKDDPDLMRICEEAYHQRGNPMTGDE